MWCLSCIIKNVLHRGVEQLAARRAHNPKVVSSSLTPATTSQLAKKASCFFMQKNSQSLVATAPFPKKVLFHKYFFRAV